MSSRWRVIDLVDYSGEIKIQRGCADYEELGTRL